MGYLIDSNVLIDYVAERFTDKQLQKLDSIFDEGPNLSIISKIETLAFHINPEEEAMMLAFLDSAQLYDLTDEIVMQTIAIRKSIKLKIPDAIIGATALVHRQTLITRNITDFKRIDGLKIENPHSY